MASLLLAGALLLLTVPGALQELRPHSTGPSLQSWVADLGEAGSLGECTASLSLLGQPTLVELRAAADRLQTFAGPASSCLAVQWQNLRTYAAGSVTLIKDHQAVSAYAPTNEKSIAVALDPRVASLGQIVDIGIEDGMLSVRATASGQVTSAARAALGLVQDQAHDLPAARVRVTQEVDVDSAPPQVNVVATVRRLPAGPNAARGWAPDVGPVLAAVDAIATAPDVHPSEIQFDDTAKQYPGLWVWLPGAPDANLTQRVLALAGPVSVHVAYELDFSQ